MRPSEEVAPWGHDFSMRQRMPIRCDEGGMTVRSRKLVEAALGIGISLCCAAADARQLDCELGRYLPVSVTGEKSNASIGEVVQAAFEVTPERIAMPGLCGPVRPRQFRVNRRGVVKIRAAWRRCAGIKGRVRLRVEISEGCGRLVGVRWTGKKRERIVAAISQCGDARVDSGAGEECDPPGFGIRCGRNAACTNRCVCEVGGGEPPLVSTTTTSTTTPALHSTTTTLDLPPSSTSSTHTSTTVTSTTTTLPYWIQSGPVRWSTPPPAVVEGGETFPLALEIAVSAERLEGTILACDGVYAPENCRANNATSDLWVDQPDFSGPPGVFTFTGGTDYQCYTGRHVYFLARIFVVDNRGDRIGPFFSPIAEVEIQKSTREGLGVYPPALIFNLLSGQRAQPQSLFVGRTCLAFDGEVLASAPWVRLSQQGTGTFSVDVDAAALPAAGSPYRGELTLSSPTVATGPIIVPVTVNVLALEVDWLLPKPSRVMPGESFEFAVVMQGNLMRVEGEIGSTGSPPRPRFINDRFDFGEARSPIARFEGSPGRFEFVGRRQLDCEDASTRSLSAHFTVTDSSGAMLGPFVSASPAIDLPAAPGPAIEAERRAVVLRGLVGLAPLPEALEVEISCFDVGEVAWAASADVPWLTATARQGRLSGNFYEPDEVILDADVSALDPVDSPFHGTVSLSVPTLSATATVDVTLAIPDLTVRWIEPPPASLRAYEEFTVSLEIVGDAAAVDGQLHSCARGYFPNELCLARTRFAMTDNGAFAGPPGTFEFTGHRIEGPDWSPENFFFAELFVTDRAGRRTGPYYSPLVPVAIPTPDRSSLGLFPSVVEIFGFAGQHPLVGGLRIFSRGSNEFGWTAIPDVPWLWLSPSRGTVRGIRESQVRVAVNTIDLPAAHVPALATVRIDAPGSVEGSASVPIVVHLLP